MTQQFPAGQPGTPNPYPATGQPGPGQYGQFGQPPAPRKKPFYRRAWFIIVIVLVVIGVIVAATGGDDGDDRAGASDTASATATFVPDAARPEAVAEAPAAAPREISGGSDSVPSGVPSDFRDALRSAKQYSDLMHMSKAGLYDQLTSEYADQFSPEAAQYAVDNVDADWNRNALKSAESYSETMHKSKAGIYDQLTSEYGEQFTPEEADYAVANLG